MFTVNSLISSLPSSRSNSQTHDASEPSEAGDTFSNVDGASDSHGYGGETSDFEYVVGEDESDYGEVIPDVGGHHHNNNESDQPINLYSSGESSRDERADGGGRSTPSAYKHGHINPFNAITQPPAAIPPMMSSKSSGDLITILSGKQVDKILQKLDTPTILKSQEEAFITFSTKNNQEGPINSVQVPHRSSLVLPHHTTLFMPAKAPATEQGATQGKTSIKIVSVPTSGTSTEGLPASVFILDESTGKVRTVINGGTLTGVRTAAGSVVATKLAVRNPSKMINAVLFGTGTQAFWHAHLHLETFPSLQKLTIMHRSAPSSTPSARLTSLIASLTRLHPNITISAVSTLSPIGGVIHDANLIVCCTPSTVPLFNSTDVCSGTHICLVGSYKPHMMEAQVDVVRRAGVVFVDGSMEARSEAGELQGWGDDGVCEVGRLLGGPTLEDERKRTEDRWKLSGGDITMWKSVGLGVQDILIAHLVEAKAAELGLGTVIDYE